MSLLDTMSWQKMSKKWGKGFHCVFPCKGFISSGLLLFQLFFYYSLTRFQFCPRPNWDPFFFPPLKQAWTKVGEEDRRRRRLLLLLLLLQLRVTLTGAEGSTGTGTPAEFFFFLFLPFHAGSTVHAVCTSQKKGVKCIHEKGCMTFFLRQTVPN